MELYSAGGLWGPQISRRDLASLRVNARYKFLNCTLFDEGL